MSKKIIVIIVLVALLVGAGIFVYFKFFTSKGSVDPTITNEKGKAGNTTLNSDRTLVVYFSESGNTQKLAKLISDRVGGDFIRIKTVKDYPTVYATLASDAKAERDNDERPELKDLGIDLDKYDTIFIGYPIWWYQMPMAMYTFFDTYDFSGKTIVPFNTHEGSGDGGTYEDIK